MINKYTLNEDKQYKYLKRNGTKLFCFKQDSVIGCGSWCPAFLEIIDTDPIDIFIEKGTGIKKINDHKILLKCIEQEFVIEENE